MEELRHPTSVGLPLEELRLLSDKYRMEYLVYHALSVGFGSLGDAFFMQQHCSQTRHHQKGCDTVCRLLRNPVLHPFQVMIRKDRQFQAYIHDYSRSKIKAEMRKLIANIYLKKPATDISPENFERFLYIAVDMEH